MPIATRIMAEMAGDPVLHNKEQDLMQSKLKDWMRKKQKTHFKIQNENNCNNPFVLQDKRESIQRKNAHDLNASQDLQKIKNIKCPSELNNPQGNIEKGSNDLHVKGTREIQLHSTSSAAYRQLMNRNKALRISHKINRTKDKIAEIDVGNKMKYLDATQEISNTISEIKNLIETDEKLKFLHFDVTPSQEKINECNNLLNVLSNSNLLEYLKSSAQMLNICGEVYFQSSELSLQPLLNEEHLKKINLQMKLSNLKLNESLMTNHKNTIEMEIKMASESIFLLRMKLKGIQ